MNPTDRRGVGVGLLNEKDLQAHHRKGQSDLPGSHRTPVSLGIAELQNMLVQLQQGSSRDKYLQHIQILN